MLQRNWQVFEVSTGFIPIFFLDSQPDIETILTLNYLRSLISIRCCLPCSEHSALCVRYTCSIEDDFFYTTKPFRNMNRSSVVLTQLLNDFDRQLHSSQ